MENVAGMRMMMVSKKSLVLISKTKCVCMYSMGKQFCNRLLLKISYSRFLQLSARGPRRFHISFWRWVDDYTLIYAFQYYFHSNYRSTPTSVFLIRNYKLYITQNLFIWHYFIGTGWASWYYNYYTRLFDPTIYYLIWRRVWNQTFGEGFLYIRGLFIIFFIDGCLTDDEPIWEPLEWSLIQTWILFIFIFAWVAENLITSRFGSYTGRDKRIWFAWYKTFWLIELMYLISYGVAGLFVIVPFYYELTYHLSYIFCWWHWYTRVFFFKFISLYTIIILISYLFQLGIRWLNWKKLFFFVVVVNIFVAYLLYTSFVISFFGYFTDPVWYQKTRSVDYVQLSHEPWKWGWGAANRDHFTYHNVSTVFWFKSDGPFAGAFLMFHLFFFLAVFFFYLYWVILLRRMYVMKEVTYTFSIFVISTLKQFLYFFLLLFIFIFFSFIVTYWRFPIEFWWSVDYSSWWVVLWWVCYDYCGAGICLFR